ncbi:hypothetical protein L596_005460 [Steinernema carpocapsae]|uniref:DUF7808 domain-containing protein n=1 Tax=Steinernema carpocapsae TaxID=34508 RepID=A0A4U8UZ30_STECR|nr:hypothetical protein L596_005460 [Steinernema carpocapsae]
MHRGRMDQLFFLPIVLVFFLKVQPSVTLSKPPIESEKTAIVDVTYHWESRSVECEKTFGISSDVSQCALRSDNKNTVFGEGCYDEFVPTVKNIRNLCPLDCRNADESTILGKAPTNNHRCSQFFNYGIVKVANEVYLWRSGTCLNATISFQIRCGFPFAAPTMPGPESFLTII